MGKSMKNKSNDQDNSFVSRQTELTRERNITSAVRRVIEAYESGGKPLSAENNKGLMDALRLGKGELMKETGLKPKEFYDLVMKQVKPKMVLVQRFTSAELSCEKDPIIQDAINKVRQVLNDDIKTNDDELLQQVLSETGLKKNKLYEMFLSKADAGYNDFVRGIRFEAAFKILAKKEEVTSEDYQSISDDAGMYIDGVSLSMAFKRSIGLSIVEFHKALHAKADNILKDHVSAYQKAVKGGSSEEDAFEEVCSSIHSDAYEILEETCLEEEAFLEKFQNRIDYEPPA